MEHAFADTVVTHDQQKEEEGGVENNKIIHDLFVTIFRLK